MKNIMEFTKKVKNVSILVIGDVILDSYVFGNVCRISQESPIPILSKENEEERLGGAGNVANNISTIGGNITLFSIVGKDENAIKIRNLCSEKGINNNLIEDNLRKTTVKTRFISNNHQLLRVDREDAYSIESKIENKILDDIEKIIKYMQIVILSDYNKGIFTKTITNKIIQIANLNKVPVFVDPKGKDYSKYKNATIITPNISEVLEFSSFFQLQSFKSICHAIMDFYSIQNVLLTKSEQGMDFFQKNEKRTISIPTKAKEVYDVSGAGDTVIAFLGASYASGFSMEDSAKIANMAAGISVGKRGTSAVTSDELIRHSKNMLNRIIFTNGCFDILHDGHIALLKKAKELGGFLIVGINSDKSIQELKGKGRPILKEHERVTILSSLKFVDKVIVFDDKTPYKLIKEVNPDIIVKGGDYTLDRVVGKDIVEQNGGEVIIFPYIEGKSTSNIIEKIKENNKNE